jgi:hypothetical protein
MHLCGAHGPPNVQCYKKPKHRYTIDVALLILTMSAVLSNSSSFDAAEIPDFASVIISAYAEETSPALRLMLLYAVLGVTCLPLLLVAFYFSSPRIRRTPLFKIVVFDILLGVAVSCWMTTMTVRHMSSPP